MAWGIGCYVFLRIESGEFKERELILSNLNNQQSLEIDKLNNQLDDYRIRLIITQSALVKVEGETLIYQTLYNNLDRHFDEYLQYKPASTVSKSQIELNIDSLNLSRPGKYRLCNVAGTGSMRPIIEHGFVVLLEKTSEVQVGDIAVYEDKLGHEIIHRVIGEDGDCWIFRGDANLCADLPVPKENVTWRVVGVFY